jgi:hypothetical protein
LGHTEGVREEIVAALIKFNPLNFGTVLAKRPRLGPHSSSDGLLSASGT